MDIINANVKQEFMIVSFLGELGKNLIKDMLKPSKENITSRFIEEIAAEANPTWAEGYILAAMYQNKKPSAEVKKLVEIR